MKRYTNKKAREWTGKHADQRTVGRSNYPASPAAGRGIMRIYERLLKQAIKGKKSFRALVFGATPETRDLVLKYGGELTTIDISLEMILKCNALMSRAGNEKEIIVKGDWLNNPLPNNYYDIILGDGVSNNVALVDQDNFFREIRRLLKKNGFLILRDVILDSERPRRRVGEINQDFVDGRIHWFDVFFDLYFYSDFTPRVYNPTKARWFMSKLFAEIKKAYSQKRLSKRSFEALWWFRGNLIHCFLPRPRLEGFISKYFKLLPIKQARDFRFTQDTMIFFFGEVKK